MYTNLVWQRYNFEYEDIKILEELINRYTKMLEETKKVNRTINIFYLFALLPLIIVFYKFYLSDLSILHFFDYLSILFDPMFFTSASVAVFLFIEWQREEKKREEKKKKYNTIREEVIDRLLGEWQQRYQPSTLELLIKDLEKVKINISFKG